MLNEIQQVETNATLLFGSAEVETALQKMAMGINTLLRDRDPILLCVMNGGVVTAGKLLMHLDFPLTIDSINASRYCNNTSGGDTIYWLYTPQTNLQGKTVLIVDDILDEGKTLEAIYQYCYDKGATSIYSAVLINKLLKNKKPIDADFIGLEAPNRYLFGYGMDYKGYLRNASGIYACQEDSSCL